MIPARASRAGNGAQASPRRPARRRAPRHERFRKRVGALHPPPDRDFAAGSRGAARRRAGLLAVAGLRLAAGRFPDHPGHDAAAGREPRHVGIGLEDLRFAIVNANVAGPKGSFDGAHQSYTIAANDQIAAADAYRSVVVTYRNGAPVLLSDVANVLDGLENTKVGGWYEGAPAVIVDVQRQPGANVIETVQRVLGESPKLQRAMPAGAKLTVVSDRTNTIRASVRDVQFTLILAVALVVLVVLIFLRTVRATFIAGVALPLSLVATFGVMWFCGFSLDNLSLMALTIGTGFVIDDAIVMIENIVRHMEDGEAPLGAALNGAREIGFTVISLTVSLIAVFIPLLFMTGLVGRMFREFALTLTIAVVVSAIVSLTLTPMMCAKLLRHEGSGGGNRITRWFNSLVDGSVAFYGRSLEWVLRHQGMT